MSVQTSTVPTATEARQASARLRRQLGLQLIFELALPLAGYYGLRAAGAAPWLALTAGGALTAPWILYGLLRHRRLDMTALFTLSLLLVGAAASAVTGDPRLMLVKDGAIGALLGLWFLGSVPTRRPFIMTTSRAVVVAKVGVAGADAWEARWEDDADFRRHIRILSAIWGVVFLGDAGIRVALAYALPLDAAQGITTIQWLVVLGGLLVFHARYVARTGLKV
ncbi:VC0807 family protein [Phenylobacterium aquaticum]|uniref:VC0807 family protein n=1 Tax=Phenylobacterium aquaticum TaxID=1763816 RepID=UPI001F5DD4FE|nr:VC0807 family protein [Phenylobacterium aquaticum]MCI3134642.1 hypothetical protein [Phenylobacterium aquaticum]